MAQNHDKLKKHRQLSMIAGKISMSSHFAIFGSELSLIDYQLLLLEYSCDSDPKITKCDDIKIWLTIIDSCLCFFNFSWFWAIIAACSGAMGVICQMGAPGSKTYPLKPSKIVSKIPYLEKKTVACHIQNMLKIAILGPKTHCFAIDRGLWVDMGPDFCQKVFQHTLGSHSVPVSCTNLDFRKK